MTDPGEREPAEECSAARMLVARRGRFEEDMLWRRRPSDSTEYDEPDLRGMGTSVLI